MNEPVGFAPSNFRKTSHPVSTDKASERTIRPMAEMTGQYYILLRVEDRPGVLAEIASVFGRSEVSIKSVWQEGFGDDAQLVFITHRAREGAFQEAIGVLRALPGVEEVRSVLRVEAEE